MRKQSYDQWREGEVRKVGLDRQLKAESIVDRQLAEPMVTVIDHEDKRKKQYRKGVADVYRKRGRVTLPAIVSAPSEAYRRNYDLIDWSLS